ncbi:MAG TPA: hypothetical protein VI669_07160 [Vicinamibacteria bacterium]
MRTEGTGRKVRERHRVVVGGDDRGLVDRLAGPLQNALAGRRSLYAVHIETVGRVGEVMVSIDGTKGHVPLLFGPEDMDAGYVCSVVKDTVRRFDL